MFLKHELFRRHMSDRYNHQYDFDIRTELLVNPDVILMAPSICVRDVKLLVCGIVAIANILFGELTDTSREIAGVLRATVEKTRALILNGDSTEQRKLCNEMDEDYARYYIGTRIIY